MRTQVQRYVHRRRTLEMDVKIGGHRAGRDAGTRLFHQMHGCRPVAVAIEDGAADSAVENPFECEMMRLRPPLANHCISFGKTSDTQPFVVCGTAAEAAIVRRVGLLD